MSEALERLRERNRFEVKLEDGDLLVTLDPPQLRELFVLDAVPVDVLEHLAKNEMARESNGKAQTPDFSDLKNAVKTERVLVALTVKAIDGEEVTLTPDDTAVFTQAQFREIAAYALRQKAPPGKA